MIIDMIITPSLAYSVRRSGDLKHLSTLLTYEYSKQNRYLCGMLNNLFLFNQVTQYVYFLIQMLKSFFICFKSLVTEYSSCMF